MDRQHNYQTQQQQQNYSQGHHQQYNHMHHHSSDAPSPQSAAAVLLSQSPGGAGMNTHTTSAAVPGINTGGSGLQFQMSPPISTGPHPSFVSRSHRNSPVPKRPSAATSATNSPVPNRGSSNLLYGAIGGAGAPPSPNNISNTPMFSRSAPGSASSSRRPSAHNMTSGGMPNPGPSSLSAAATIAATGNNIMGGPLLMMPLSSGAAQPAPSPSSKIVCIRVLSALTGVVYPLRIPLQDLTIKNIRLYLSRRDVANAPLEDQILLVGPPYKVPKDATLQHESTLAALHLGDEEDGWQWADGEELAHHQTKKPSSQRHLLMHQESSSSLGEDRRTSGNLTTLTMNPSSGDDSSATDRVATPATIIDRSKRGTGSTTTSGGIGGAKRLFLFSKKALVGGAAGQQVGAGGATELAQIKVVLEPQEVFLPTELPPQHSKGAAGNTSGVMSVFQSTVTTASHPHSPLHQALDVYERRFQLIVYQANALKDACDQRLISSCTCLNEQRIILMALRAAVSNLSDHRSNATRTMAEFTTDFHSLTSNHVKLLEGFEPQLQVLSNVPLHSSLRTIAKRSGRTLETLLDCVPLEEYRSWANQCQISHERLQQAFDEIQEMFDRIGNAEMWQQQIAQDEQFEQQVSQLEQRLQNDGIGVQRRQCEKVGELTESHQRVSKVVQEAVMGGGGSTSSSKLKADESSAASSSSPPGGGVQAAFASLESLSHETSQILPQMQDDDLLLFELMNEIASMKSKGMQRIRLRLQEISQCQSLIQQFLTSVNILKESLQQQHVNVSSLEHVHLLHKAYEDFVSEVQRRRLYNLAVTTQLTQMMEVIGNMRAEEIKSREQFLRVSGRHLQPPFYEVFCPTLASPPPIFAPQLPPSSIEMDSLPVITSTELNKSAKEATCGDNVKTDTKEELTPENVLLTKDGAIEGDNSHRTSGTQLGASGDNMTNSAGTPSLKSASSTRSKDDGTSTTISNENATSKDDGRDNHAVDDVVEAAEGLIIADEGEGGDGLMNEDDQYPYEQTSKLKAERQALLYENLMLRQALERHMNQQQQSSSTRQHHHHHQHISQRTTTMLSSSSPPRSFVQRALDEIEAEQTNEREKLEEALKNIAEYETRVKGLSEESTDMKAKLTKAQTSLVKAKKKISTLQAQVNKVSDAAAVTKIDEDQKQQDATGENKLLSDKISHSSFQVGDVGLFMPTGRSKSVYLAFHSNCPHRYLSADSIPPPTASRPEPPDYILGRIVFMEQHSASGSSGSPTNPYGLPQGTPFFVLTVEILKL